MKNYLVCAALIVCAWICLSGTDKPYETVAVTVTAKCGDTLDEISGRYYDKCTRRISWQEYRYLQRDLNDDLFKNGRCLQAGDEVKIQYFICKQ